MFQFSARYFLCTLVLFLIEIYIALFVTDHFIRPHFGDVLVVIFLYCLLRTFLKISTLTGAIAVLLFAYSIEVLQYFEIVRMLGLQHAAWARIIIGTTFSWWDMLCYSIGVGIILIAEKLRGKI